jgi:hypothetical protein
MPRPKFTDQHRGRYRTAEDSRAPGYLQHRFEAIRRLLRIKARQAEANRAEAEQKVAPLARRWKA